MKKIYVPYVIYKDSEGFYNETKFVNELDFEFLKKNNGIVETYYGESYKIESINGVFENNKVIFIKDNNPFLFTVKDIVNEATNKFTELLSESINAKYMDYKRYEDSVSVEEEILKIIKKFEINLEIKNKKEFDSDKYLDLAKSLSHFCQIYVNDIELQKHLSQIYYVVRYINTFLAENNVLDYKPEDAHSRSFSVESYENTEGKMEYYFKSNKLSISDNYYFCNLKNLSSDKKTKKLKF